MNSEVEVGQVFTSEITVDDVRMCKFAELSGDTNPIHLDDTSAHRFGYPKTVAYAGVLLAEVSRIVGNCVPGPGALCVSYQFDFKAPVFVGDSVAFEVTVAQYSTATNAAVLKFIVRNRKRLVVLDGLVTVLVPTEKRPDNSVRLGGDET